MHVTPRDTITPAERTTVLAAAALLAGLLLARRSGLRRDR